MYLHYVRVMIFLFVEGMNQKEKDGWRCMDDMIFSLTPGLGPNAYKS